jgi:tetratricopeptide (TPR) repeat protein
VRSPRVWIRLAVAVALAVTVGWTTGELEETHPPGRSGTELMYFPSGILLKPMALGQPLTLADLLWFRAIQYYGEHRMTDQRFPLAGHIFETITTLDPNFAEAYIFGGLVLAAEGGDLERGLNLLRLGLARNPESWKLAFETGFVYYVAAKDNAQAARFFERASRLPGAPEYVGRFAAYVRGRIGDLIAALALWEELLENTENPATRALAERKVAEIRAELAAARRLPDPAARVKRMPPRGL